LNPYGVRGVLFPLLLLPKVTGASIFSMRIAELLPPFISGYARELAWAWVVLLAAAALSFLLNTERWHLGRLLAVAAFGALSTQTLRNIRNWAPAYRASCRLARWSSCATRASRAGRSTA
jgi:hypothetical protein